MIPTAAETSAGPLGVIIIGVTVIAMVFVFVRSMRSRATATRVRSGPLAAPAAAPLPPGSAAAMTDGAQVPAQLLLTALAVAVPLDDPDADDDDEGTGSRLGLTYHRYRHHDDVWDPPVYEGTRTGHQVFIRLGRNASVLGPGRNARRLRAVSVVRASAPPLELTAVDGALVATAPVPPPIAAMLAQLRPAPDVWHDLRVVTGPQGLAASRGLAGDWLGGWIYDLWLLERLALVLRSAPLPEVPLGREWEPPYELGDWAPSAF